MKRTLIITALFLGFSVVGFSQTIETMEEGMIVSKYESQLATEMIYIIQSRSTGDLYESLPTTAQEAVGNNAIIFSKRFYSNGIITDEEIAIPSFVAMQQRAKRSELPMNLTWNNGTKTYEEALVAEMKANEMKY